MLHGPLFLCLVVFWMSFYLAFCSLFLTAFSTSLVIAFSLASLYTVVDMIRRKNISLLAT